MAWDKGSIRKKRRSKKEIVLFCIICFLVLIRLAAFPQIPGGVNQDGAMGAVDAKALGDYGTDRFGTFMPVHFRAWGYGQMSVLLSYLTVPFIKLFGLSKLAMRLPILIASLLGIAVVYGAVKKIFDKETGLAVLLLLAVNPWHFMQSRWALDCNLFPHMFALGLFFLISNFLNGKKVVSIRRRNGRLYGSMVFFGLCMYCYGVSFYMVPVFLLISCILLLCQKKVTWRQAFVCLCVYFGVAWPIYGTMLINFMKWETASLPFVTMEFFEGSIRASDILFFSENIGEQLLHNIKSLANVVFWQKEDLLWNSIKEFGPMYRGTLPFILLGAGLTIRGAFKEKNAGKKIGCQLLAVFWLCALMTGIVINSVNINRINIIFYIHIIFLAVGGIFVVRKWRPVLYLLGTVLGIQSLLFFYQYFTDWAKEIEKAFYGDFVEALEFVKEYDCDRYYITPDTQYQGAQDVTEILTLFVFDVDARYYQGKTDFWQEKEIPYRERFVYSNPPEAWKDGSPPEGDVYVFRTGDLYKFAGDRFYVALFGEYAVAVDTGEFP
ncbi:MAG: glycosyltransferase family 39 protein [Clostridium sp.]|nr:glycosyltransferase family 39 protein [Clostridium sp.]